MGHWIVTLAFLLLSVEAQSVALDRTVLTGKVTDDSGKPVKYATVLVYHAGVKTGYSAFCPSCYRDCGKRAITDADGTYRIADLSNDLWFELLAVGNHFTPTLLNKVDPMNGPAPTIVMKRRQSPVGVTSFVRGRVEDTNGNPLRYAVITPFALQAGPSSIYGSPPGLDPIAVTNEKGIFDLFYAGAASKVAITVDARGMAPRFVILPTGEPLQRVVVSMGALVSGRVAKDGKPVAGIEIALMPKEPWTGGANLDIKGSAYDEIRIGTRDDGSFSIPNVPAPEQWELFATMESTSAEGTTDPIPVSTARDNEELNVGNIEVSRGFHLRGKLTPIERKPIPQGTRIYLENEFTRDVQSVILAQDGAYRFEGLAVGHYTLWANVRGYQPLMDDHALKVSVERNIDNFDVILHPKTP
jgi:hypothetical protein